MPQEEDRIRTIAGYLLKNNARLVLRAPPEVLAFVKASVLQAFVDPSVMVRNAAGQDIVAFMGILEPRNWPECLQLLVHTLESSSLDQQEVSSRPLRPRMRFAAYLVYEIRVNERVLAHIYRFLGAVLKLKLFYELLCTTSYLLAGYSHAPGLHASVLK